MSLKGLLQAFVCAGALVASTLSSAAPISIDYTFTAVTVSFNGVMQSTGDFTMSIKTDTDTPNLGGSFNDFGNMYAATVTINAPTLGLNNALVTDPTQLYFGGSVVGFEVNNFNTIITAYDGPALQFGSAFDLSTLLVPQGPISLNGMEFRTGANGIHFDNGSFFDAGQFSAFANRATVTVNAVDANGVPEPGSLALAVLGLAVLAARRRT